MSDLQSQSIADSNPTVVTAQAAALGAMTVEETTGGGKSRVGHEGQSGNEPHSSGLVSALIPLKSVVYRVVPSLSFTPTSDVAYSESLGSISPRSSSS